DPVVRIACEFVLRERLCDLVDRVRCDRKQHDPTDDLEDAVEAFQRDTDAERPLEVPTVARFVPRRHHPSSPFTVILPTQCVGQMTMKGLSDVCSVIDLPYGPDSPGQMANGGLEDWC